MAFLSKDKVKEIIQNAPEDTSPAGIIAGLRQRGHELEGYPTGGVQESAATPLVQKKKGILSRFADATDVVLGTPSKFLFGTAAGAVGSLIGQGVEAIRGKKGAFTEEFEDRFGAVGKPAKPIKAAGEIAGTGLELLPGGTLLKGAKKIPGVSKIAKGLQEGAEKQLTKALAPTTKKLKAQAKKVVPEMLSRRITFTSPKKLGESAKAKSQDVAAAIDDAMEAIPEETKLNAGLIINKMEKLRDKYRIGDVDVEETAIKQIDGIIDVVNRLAPDGQITPKSMRRLRQIWDEHYDISKGLDDISAYKKKAEKVGGDAIRQIIGEELPDVAKLNREYSFWRGVSDVSTATELRKTGQQEFGKKVISGVAGAAGGAAFGMPGYLLGMASLVMQNSGWRSVSAVTKSKIADAMSRGDISEVSSLLITVARNLGVELVAEVTE